MVAMTEASDFVAKNQAELERLRALRDRLGADGDFDRRVAPEWSVTTVLAHLAFWDEVVETTLRTWERLPADELPSRIAAPDAWINGETVQPWARLGISVERLLAMPTDERNAALAPGWSATPGIEAARAAVAAAESLDRRLAALSPEMVRLIRGGSSAWMLDPWEHRNEHIDQIEAALAR